MAVAATPDDENENRAATPIFTVTRLTLHRLQDQRIGRFGAIADLAGVDAALAIGFRKAGCDPMPVVRNVMAIGRNRRGVGLRLGADAARRDGGSGELSEVLAILR